MRIHFNRQAERDLACLERAVQERIVAKMRHVAAHGVPSGSLKRLSGKTLYRIRVGDYRVIGTVENNTLFILLIRHRKDVYRELD